MPGNKPDDLFCMHALLLEIPVLSSCSQYSPRPSLKDQQHLRPVQGLSLLRQVYKWEPGQELHSSVTVLALSSWESLQEQQELEPTPTAESDS